MEESSQRAHATFENGADPSGPDRGLNLSLPQERVKYVLVVDDFEVC